MGIVGAVLGSPVGDLGHTFRRLNGGLLAGLPALVVAALAQVYPDLDRVIKEHTNAEGRALLDSLHDMTTVGAVVRMANKNMGDYLDEPLEDILSEPRGHACLRQHQAGRLGAGASGADRAGGLRLPDRRRRHRRARRGVFGRGADVSYHRDAFNEHMLLHPLSAPMALRWLTDRFAGRPLKDHLIRTAWPTMFNPITYGRHGATGHRRRQGPHRPKDPAPPAVSR